MALLADRRWPRCAGQPGRQLCRRSPCPPRAPPPGWPPTPDAVHDVSGDPADFVRTGGW